MVLVVDDHVDMAQLVARYIRLRCGYESVGVGSAHAALRVIEESLPYVVVLDVMMPEVDGIELLKVIRSNPKSKGIPVIMYSADNSISNEEQAAELGVQGFVVKGAASWERLCDLVRQYVPG